MSHPAGWYPDPSDPSLQRYWDGVQWTPHTAPANPVGFKSPTSVAPDPTQTQPVWGVAPPEATSSTAATNYASTWGTGPAVEPPQNPTQQKKSGKGLVIGVLVLGALLLIALIAAALGSDDKTDSADPSVSTETTAVATTASVPDVTVPVEGADLTTPSVTEPPPTVAPPPPPPPSTTAAPPPPDPSASESVSQKNARRKAESYLEFTGFSRRGLIEQLEFEGFSNADATYGADAIGADWNDQAAKKAESYLEFTSFSRSGLIEQLEFEGFTREQAEYGASKVGY